MNDPLEIINAQGAQVTQLKQQLQQAHLIIALLTNGEPGNHRYNQQLVKEITSKTAVNWRQNKDGTVVINVRKDDNA